MLWYCLYVYEGETRRRYAVASQFIVTPFPTRLSVKGYTETVMLTLRNVLALFIFCVHSRPDRVFSPRTITGTYLQGLRYEEREREFQFETLPALPPIYGGFATGIHYDIYRDI